VAKFVGGAAAWRNWDCLKNNSFKLGLLVGMNQTGQEMSSSFIWKKNIWSSLVDGDEMA